MMEKSQVPEGTGSSAAPVDEKKFYQLIQNAPAAIYEVNFRIRRFTFVNDAMAALTGYSREELLAIDPFELLDDPGRAAFQYRIGQWLRGERPDEDMEYKIRTKDGQELWVLLNVSFTLGEDGRPEGATVIGHIVTERRRMEDRLAWSARRNALLSDTAARLLQSGDPQGQVEDLCHRVMAFLDCQVFFNFLLDAHSGRLHLNACAGIPAEEIEKIEWLDCGEGASVCGCVAKIGERMIVSDIGRSRDPMTDLVRSYGVQAYACHPIMVQERLIGTLSFGTRTRTKFSAEEVEVMESVTNLVAVAMNRIQTENALRQSREDLARAQAVGQIGSWRMDIRKNELLWSDENYDIFEVAKDTPLTYEAFLGFIHPDDRRQVDMQWQAALLGEPYDIEHRIVVSNGRVKWVREKAYLEFDPFGTLCGGFGITQDITALKRTEAVLQQSNQQLQEADRRKDEFLAMLAHELRNPLAPIRTSAELLKVQISPEHARAGKWIETIRRQVAHLARILDDLLDTSRISRGLVALHKERIYLNEVVAQAIETVRPLVESKNQDLHLAVTSEAMLLEADPVRLVQILTNLLNNAAKFTPSGGDIWLRTYRESDQAVIEVQDTGIGLSPEILSQIFDLFYQADKTLARTQGGLGLGLTLVRQLTQLHGGSIEAQSAGDGKGSLFTLRLPLLAWPSSWPDPAEAPAQGARMPEGNTRFSLRVMLVDDNRDFAESLDELIQAWGHATHLVHDGRQVLERAKEFRPDVILLDIGLPGMDGYMVAGQLHTEPCLAGTKLLALTGYNPDPGRLSAAGFCRHFTKPMDVEALERLLAGLVMEKKGAQA